MMDPEMTQQPLCKSLQTAAKAGVSTSLVREGRLQCYLIGILIQHDHNLGHVVQLTDHFQVVHGPLPLLIFGLLRKKQKTIHQNQLTLK